MGAPQFEQAGADISGTGTTNTIPRWTGASTLGDSGLIDDGTQIYTTARSRFGIGIATPDQGLHVLSPNNATTSGGQVTQQNFNGVSNQKWMTSVGGGDNVWVNGRGWFLRDMTAGATRIVCDTSGNVGIGTTSPASRLDVAGTITCDDAGTGLKLPATPGNADTQTLDCYQENTWTATDGSGAGLTFTVNNTAVYTRVGRLVHARIDITFPSTVNGSNALVLLPFNAIAYGGTAFVYASGVGSVMMLANSTGIEFYTAAGVRMTNGALSTLRIIGSIVYQAA